MVLINKFVEMESGMPDQYEAHGLLEAAPPEIHCTGGFCAKPNPSYVAMGSFDAELIRKDLEDTVEICRRHNTPCELILKDVSTVCNDPSRLTRWEQIAMEVVNV